MSQENVEVVRALWEFPTFKTVELLTGIVWRFKEGKISEYAGYYDLCEAFEAAGLRQ